MILTKVIAFAVAKRIKVVNSFFFLSNYIKSDQNRSNFNKLDFNYRVLKKILEERVKPDLSSTSIEHFSLKF